MYLSFLKLLGQGVELFRICLVGSVLNKWKWVVKFSELCNQRPPTIRCQRVVCTVFDVFIPTWAHADSQ